MGHAIAWMLIAGSVLICLKHRGEIISEGTFYHVDPRVVSRSKSQLLAHPRIFRLFMKGKFDAYVLLPL